MTEPTPPTAKKKYRRPRQFGILSAIAILREIAEDKKQTAKDRLRAIELMAMMNGSIRPVVDKLANAKMKAPVVDLLGVND